MNISCLFPHKSREIKRLLAALAEYRAKLLTSDERCASHHILRTCPRSRLDGATDPEVSPDRWSARVDSVRACERQTASRQGEEEEE